MLQINTKNVQDLATQGLYVGIGTAVIPTLATGLIASSKIIAVHIIANIAIRILSANTLRITVSGISFIQVPLLWKASLILAIAGASIAALSASALAVNALYLYLSQEKRFNS